MLTVAESFYSVWENTETKLTSAFMSQTGDMFCLHLYTNGIPVCFSQLWPNDYLQ